MNSKRRRIARLIHSRVTSPAAETVPAITEPAAEAAAPSGRAIELAMSSEVVVDTADELASGIAEVFAAMRASVEGEETTSGLDRDTAAAQDLTFQLLSELDRLWEQAA